MNGKNVSSKIVETFFELHYFQVARVQPGNTIVEVKKNLHCFFPKKFNWTKKRLLTMEKTCTQK